MTAAASASGQQTGAPHAPAPQRPACRIEGAALSGLIPLPGVLVTAASGFSPGPLTTATGPDGTFVLDVPGPGDYSVKAEFPAFADVTRSVTIGPSCRATVDFTMILASRAPEPGPQPAAEAGAATGAPAAAGAAPGGPGQPPAGRGAPGAPARPAWAAAAARGEPGAPPPAAAAAASDDSMAVAAAHLSLPPGFSIDTSGESVAALGAAGQINPNLMFGPPGEGPGGMGGGMPGMGGPGGAPGMGAEGRPPDAGMQGGFGGMGGGGMPQFAGGGPGGMEGGRGGGGRGGMGGLAGAAGRLQMAGRLQQNRTRLQFSYNLGGSPFNARPYAINGQSPNEPSNLQHRFGVNIGGPLRVPGLFDAGPRTNYVLNYSGSRGRTFRESYSRVPTSAQRSGDLSSSTGVIHDPLTGAPFEGNRIPADRISPAAASLLALYPLPNQDTAGQNYHFATTVVSHSDDVNVRLTRSFGTAQAGRGGGPGGGRGGMMGGPGGRGGGSVNVSLGVQFRRSSGDQATSFPALAGKNAQTGWNVPASVVFQRWGLFNSVNVQYNRSRATTTNRFANVRDVAGEAGIAGVSTDPFSWGAPSLSFTTFSGLRDITPSERTDQTITLSLSQSRMRGRHTLRWGADVRWMRNDSRSDSNPRGSFVFTGLYSQRTKIAGAGNDFADFLLGLPQQASLQYGPGTLRFRSSAWSAFVQDDWRVRANLTINAGVRYEYLSPYREANNRLVNLDVAPDFTAAVPVLAGQAGPFTGRYPATIVEPDWNNAAPRIGVAWRPRPRLVVRAGYGISYSSPVYQGMARQLAAQPPFAVTDTRIGTLAAPLSMAAVFARPGADQTTNNFGVDREYDLGHLQMWNAGVTRDLTRTLSVGLTYVGTKGGSLDLLRAPNRGPEGLLIDGVQAFTWESSGGRSIMHSLSMQLRRRPARGVGGGLTYTWSKAMDNASSLGGGGGGSGVVAQNDKDLEAEWGLSGFDQRHRLQADFSVELPFGPNRRWLNNDGWAAKALGGWSWNASVTLAAGTPLTARVVGSTSDVARGVNGTLRADYNGQRIALANPTVARFFNTAAFSVPAPGLFGNSARNLIVGPGQRNASMSLMKTLQLKPGRSVSVRVQANNVFNTVQFAAIDTTVNSPTFGQVLSVRSMRSVQFNVRLGL
ncbi:MAG TPA: TonB-dependent receptor [Vicinamibacterales bacterium]|nr:TonB-dependent receptor [Vicinamibacterales bacterium]